MATFPVGRTLIVPPSQNYGRLGTASLTSPKARYPASAAIDGTIGGHARSVYATDALVLDLGSTKSPNIFGVFQHNIDRNLVCGFHASASAGFGSLVLDRGAAARRPHFWLDLRGFPPTARYFRLAVNGNSKPITLGEVVVAEGFVFTGALREPVHENIQFWQERDTLEYGKVAMSVSGSLTRTGTLSMSLTAAELVLLEQIFDEAGALGERVIVVPDTRVNDLWFVEWPEVKDITYTRSDQAEIEVSIPLVEESGGVI